MLEVSLTVIAVFVGVLFYRKTQKAGREFELRRIQNELAALSRLRQEPAEGELVGVPAKARRG